MSEVTLAALSSYFAHGHHRDLLVGFVLPSLAGVIVGLAVTRYAERLQRHRYSKLVFGDIKLFPQKDERGSEAHIWRMTLVNRSIHPARDVIAECLAILDNGVPRSETMIAPLNWAHNPPNVYHRDIFRDQSAYLDVVQWNDTYGHPMVAMPPVMGIPQFSKLASERSILHLLVSQSSGQRFHVIVEARFETADKRDGVVRVTQIRRSIGATRFWWWTQGPQKELVIGLGPPRTN